MISITRNKEAARALKNAVIGIDGIRQNPVGTVIEYHIGSWVDNIGTSAVGKMAMKLYQEGHVHLVQKLLRSGDDPQYGYWAVVR